MSTDKRTGRMTWVKWYLVEVRGLTASLSPEALGAWHRMMDRYLSDQAPLEDNESTLRRITGVPRRRWPDVRDELLEVFELQDGYLHSGYADREIARFRKRSRQNATNIRQRWDVVHGDIEDVES